jgi:hypothetical protein
MLCTYKELGQPGGNCVICSNRSEFEGDKAVDLINRQPDRTGPVFTMDQSSPKFNAASLAYKLKTPKHGIHVEY